MAGLSGAGLCHIECSRAARAKREGRSKAIVVVNATLERRARLRSSSSPGLPTCQIVKPRDLVEPVVVNSALTTSTGIASS